jgi:replication factor A1
MQLTQQQKTYAPKLTLGEIKSKGLGSTDQVETAKTRATVTFVRKEGTMWYEACKDPACKNKKVQKETDFGSVTYRCTSCGATTSECSRRYILSFVINDNTGSQWVSSFDDVGKLVVGEDADSLASKLEAKESNSDFDEAMWRASFNMYSMSLKCQLSQGGPNSTGEPKTKYTVGGAWPVGFVGETKSLLSKISAYQDAGLE